MLTKRPPIQNVSPTPISFGLNVLLEKTDISALLQKQAIAEFSFEHLQTSIQEFAPDGPASPSESTRGSVQQQVESGLYPESDYQWLAEVLETLADIVGRNANNDFAVLTEADYEQLDAVLKELIYIVGDDEKQPLAPLMDFIGVLVSRYEDKHFPKLTDLFPELAEDVNSNDIKDENQQDSPTKEPEKTTNTLAAEAFFSIGNCLLAGGKKEGAILAYDQAIYLNHYESAVANFDETLRLNLDNSLLYVIYVSRGIAKFSLGYHEEAIANFDDSIQQDLDHSLIYIVYFLRGYSKWVLGEYEDAVADFDKGIRLYPNSAEAYLLRGEANALLGRTQEAKADFQKALELADQTANQELKTEIEHSLQELDNTE